MQQLEPLDIRHLLHTKYYWKLAHFNQKPSAETQNAEKSTAACAAEHANKGKLTLPALGTPSIDQILTRDTFFEQIYLHLILSNYPSATDVEKLNKTSELFTHFHKILSHAELNIEFKLLQNYPDYASQTSTTIERRL